MNRSFKRLMKGIYIGLFCASLLMVANVLLPNYFSSKKSQHLSKDALDQADVNLNKENNDRVIRSLQHQVADIKKLLDTKTKQLQAVEKLKLDVENGGNFKLPADVMDIVADGGHIIHFIKEQLQKSDVLKATALRNEYDVRHFSMFNREFVYQLDVGLKMSPRDYIAGRKDLSQDLTEVILEGVKSLNHGLDSLKVSPTYQFTNNDFIYGLFRTEQGVGTHYDVVYKPTSSGNIVNKGQLFKITLFRPFAPLQSVATSSANEFETIHFIVPLQERSDTFKIFLEYFKDFAVADGSVHLTVVYYGAEGLAEIEQRLQLLGDVLHFQNYKLIKVTDEAFSRGRALQRGAESIQTANPLLFFCDVDVAFTREFLNQCRAHSVTGKSVFYPILFSLFNPALVYKNAAIPSLRGRLRIKRNHGLWRDFGFGMTCQYLSDFKRMGGFDLTLDGWGSEDTELYRKFVQSDIMVVRTPVYSLFHHWHEKFCDKSLSAEQYKACLKSRARTEGSQVHLGLQYFELKDRIEAHEQT